MSSTVLDNLNISEGFEIVDETLPISKSSKAPRLYLWFSAVETDIRMLFCSVTSDDNEFLGIVKSVSPFAYHKIICASRQPASLHL